MLPYCLECRANIKKKKNRRLMVLSNCVVCDSKKSKFIKKEATRL